MLGWLKLLLRSCDFNRGGGGMLTALTKMADEARGRGQMLTLMCVVQTVKCKVV